MNLGKPLLEELFNKQIRFKIPVFQRHYVWNEKEQLQPLWDDFYNKFNERLNKHKLHPHYTGSIVLFHENTGTSTLSTFSVIDGQQRLTTFQIFISAFRESCRKHLNDESLINELNKYLYNEKSFGDKDYENQKFKLEPTKFNKDMFNSIIDYTYEKIDESFIKPILSEYGFGRKTYRQEAKNRNKLLAAYLFFYDKLDDFIESSTLEISELIKASLLVIKRDFQFVEIGLQNDDDPQMIFETMNGRGATLTETDLIRNYIFMRANSNEENLDSIYDKYWDEFDDPESVYKWHARVSRGRYYESNLQFFIIDYLTLKLKNEIRYDQVFYQYKFFTVNQSTFQSVEDELKELKKYSLIYKKITTPDESTTLGRLAMRLFKMGISTIYPLLLFIECNDKIDLHEKEKIYKCLDSYITRRFLCGFTTKNYNNVFTEYLKALSIDNNAESFINLLKMKTSETNLWPSDNILKEKLIYRPIYRQEKNKTHSISNILLEIEKFIRGKKQEKIKFEDTGLTIEHLLPQKWYEHWNLEDKKVPEEDFNISVHAVMTEEDKNGKYHKIENRNRILHSIGNLTILTESLNPSISNSSYEVKKKEIAKHSTLVLNSYFQEKDKWDEEQIEIRSYYLFEKIKEIWPI